MVCNKRPKDTSVKQRSSFQMATLFPIGIVPWRLNALSLSSMYEQLSCGMFNIKTKSQLGV
jgi:hypothetical protein